MRFGCSLFRVDSVRDLYNPLAYFRSDRTPVDREMSQMDPQVMFAIFTATLGLVPTWRASLVAFDKEAEKLAIGLAFPKALE